MGVEAYYNDFYRDLARIDGEGNAFAKVENLLPTLRQGSRILDIGCGFGNVCKALSSLGHDVAGVDINAEAVSHLRQHGIRAFSFDLNGDWPLHEEFDLILMLEVLEHLFDPIAALKQARERLAPGGWLIISVPTYFDLLDRLRILFTGRVISHDNLCYGPELYGRFRTYNYDHLRFFRPNEILELVDLLGYTVDELTYSPIRVAGAHFLNQVLKIVSNAKTAAWRPGLLAHGMALRLKVR